MAGLFPGADETLSSLSVDMWELGKPSSFDRHLPSVCEGQSAATSKCYMEEYRDVLIRGVALVLGKELFGPQLPVPKCV